MKNNLNKEEKLLRDKLNQAESGFSYQESSWQEMQQLIQKKGFLAQYASIFKAGIGFAILIGAVYLINSSLSESNSTNSTAVKKASNTQATTTTIETSIDQKENTTQKQILKADKEHANATEVAIAPKEAKTDTKQDASKIEVEENSSAKPNDINSNEKEAIATLPTEIEASELEVSLNNINLNGQTCIGNKIIATAIVSGKDSKYLSYKWKIDGQELGIRKAQAEFEIKKAGLLQIEVDAYLKGKRVSNREIEIRIPEVVEIDFTYKDLESPYDDLKAEFEVKPEGLSQLNWTIEGTDADINGQEASYTFESKGVYDVTLTHKSKFGCVSSASKPVSVELNFMTLAPDAFTPDGNDLNESFIPVGFTPEAGIIENDNFRMSIYDYNGNLVYTTTSNQEPWNGRLNNQGNILSEGAYVWKVELKNSKGQQANYAGKVRIRY